MPSNWDPKVYWARAQQWRDAAAALPPGETRDAYIQLAEGYETLANLVGRTHRQGPNETRNRGDSTPNN